ncbi:hypothetical protein [Bacillus toyonensis]|uniref:hypothetical protein n=1 Tax=Bacillus toyonensis TaxID=155322 RepID=UPI002E23D135|nr:hypothetical protein [Bacillus toyonensis]
MKQTNDKLNVFKNIISERAIEIFGDVEEIESNKLRVELDNGTYIDIDLNEPWQKYLETNDEKVINNFIKMQNDIFLNLDQSDNTYESIKKSLLLTIRSTELIEALKSNGNIYKEQLGKNLNAVVISNQDTYSQVVTKSLYDDLPNKEELFDIARDNLLQKGWVGPSQTLNEDLFDLYIFEDREYNSHFQFFIREWMDKEFGNCYISFPSNNVALVLRLKQKDWKSWIKCLEFYTKIVKKTFDESKSPLSPNIVEYKDGQHIVL